MPLLAEDVDDEGRAEGAVGRGRTPRAVRSVRVLPAMLVERCACIAGSKASEGGLVRGNWLLFPRLEAGGCISVVKAEGGSRDELLESRESVPIRGSEVLRGSG